jgi:hypothetical protein
MPLWQLHAGRVILSLKQLNDFVGGLKYLVRERVVILGVRLLYHVSNHRLRRFDRICWADIHVERREWWVIGTRLDWRLKRGGWRRRRRSRIEHWVFVPNRRSR